MTFTPSLTIITEEPLVRTPADLSAESIFERFPALTEAEAACFTGSIAAGWGNLFSDIDIFAFSDRELVFPMDETAESWKSDLGEISSETWMGRYGDQRVDLKVWPTNAVETVLAGFNTSPEPEFTGASPDLRDFVYRVSIGRPLINDEFFRRMRELIAGSTFARSLARTRKAGAENALMDVAGQLASGDFSTARLSALLAADYALDTCLLLAGDLCPGSKWLLRRLERTPSCGITPEEYRVQILEGAFPGESDEECALRIARWTGTQLRRVEDELLVLR